jgi:pimeloyl-ACP methyl ester carboxylesterase
MLVLAAALRAGADTVTLKNGTVYHGDVDKDNTLLTVFDGLKRILVRDTKVETVTSDTEVHYEIFPVEQPLTVHAGAMPASIVSVKAQPWDEFGRRSFEYLGPKLGKPVRMTQAINALGPKVVGFRGVDGFWLGHLTTSQVPKASVLAILAKVEQKNKAERLKVCRFLIQAGWFPEALAELDRLVKDFPDPDLKARVKDARAQVLEDQAREVLLQVDVARKGQQPKSVREKLRGFPTEGAAADVLVAVREQLRRDETQDRSDRLLADAIREAAQALPSETRAAMKARLVEMLAGLADAPDAVRGRFEAFIRASEDPSLAPEARFARALSGWVVGGKDAVDDLKSAEALWSARDALQSYLSSAEGPERSNALTALQAIELAKPGEKGQGTLGLELLTQIARHAPPPLRNSDEEATGKPRLLRVRDDENQEPTEYAILLPPEYHPLRSYPAIVALHDGSGPAAAAAWWATEALRRGYIVVAPEYNLPNQTKDYRYTPSEHAAVELALRDARRRFAIDGNRVFLGGQLLGGNMAWDLGLAHPDLFAGVVAISGMPAKYVPAYKENARRVALYVTAGDLMPAEGEVFFPFVKGLIASNYDTTLVEYYRRGREDFPEELPAIFDWMDRRVRDPYPKTFKVATARSCDVRFFGVVVRDFGARRTVAPEAVHPLGQNVHAATIEYTAKNLANLIVVDTLGLQSFDVWLGPGQADFSKKLEVRVNKRKSVYRPPGKPDLDAFLEDLRIRGDRQQVYWVSVPVRLGNGRAR